MLHDESARRKVRIIGAVPRHVEARGVDRRGVARLAYSADANVEAVVGGPISVRSATLGAAKDGIGVGVDALAAAIDERARTAGAYFTDSVDAGRDIAGISRAGGIASPAMLERGRQVRAYV